MIRLLLVDDQSLFCEGFKAVLELQPDFQVVGIASNGEIAIQMVEALHPDLVLMDVQMPIMNGCDATQVIHERFPEVKVLMLTTFDDDEYLEDSLESGAVGYLLKADIQPDQVAQAIRLAQAGFGQLSPKLLSRLKFNKSESSLRSLSQVSDREREVLQLVVEGLTNQEIAKRLSIVEDTVKTHVRHLFEKFGCKNRIQLVNAAYSSLKAESSR